MLGRCNQVVCRYSEADVSCINVYVRLTRVNVRLSCSYCLDAEKQKQMLARKKKYIFLFGTLTKHENIIQSIYRNWTKSITFVWQNVWTGLACDNFFWRANRPSVGFVIRKRTYILHQIKILYIWTKCRRPFHVVNTACIFRMGLCGYPKEELPEHTCCVETHYESRADWKIVS